jgi:hypothetical protein
VSNSVEVVHIDLPIFHSPNGAFGYFSGEIEVSHPPQVDEPFPWPQHWLTRYEEFFEEQSNQVWGIAPWEWPPATRHVTMFGIVCGSREEAELLAKHVERVSGISFWEYEEAVFPGNTQKST